MQKDTLSSPRGLNVYQVITHPATGVVTFTYYDLWMMIVCQWSMDGDWVRTRAAASMVPDGERKVRLVERLWALERLMGGLPAVPEETAQLHLRRAHDWFNRREVALGGLENEMKSGGKG